MVSSIALKSMTMFYLQPPMLILQVNFLMRRTYSMLPLMIPWNEMKTKTFSFTSSFPAKANKVNNFTFTPCSDRTHCTFSKYRERTIILYLQEKLSTKFGASKQSLTQFLHSPPQSPTPHLYFITNFPGP